MAQLFSLWTLKDNTSNLDWFDQSKIDIIQDLYNDYKNWLLDDEVKYKEKFNQVFFGDLLWYENRIHRIPEWHIKWVGNADIILWNFLDWKENADLTQVACELKGAKSNLVKKQYWHGWLSPVGQWFSYKTGLKNCKWLIVSNFFEIRLYRDNQTDFEIWNLETLLDPKDDYFNLRSLYLLLNKDNLLANNGTSKTEDLLSHFRDEQLEITKKFYKEYKQLRLELLEDIKKRNPLLSVNTLVEKGQKIIDRLIFIFFCEDRGLLPDKKLKEWIERAGEFDISPWEMTKRFFKWVDQWSERLEIPDGYNGWLFKDDATLNNLNIGDDICKKFVELTNYDFHDDLSVNVLWHIFEQSISDLEEIKEDLIWKESKILKESKWRRKKDGIFYTPEYIVDYIVQNSVMKYLNEKEDECLKKYIKKKNWETLAYQEYQHILQNIKVLDPACGSGAFLVRVFDVLFEENKRVGSILNSLFDDTETYKNILTNNIYGVDLNDESVEITKLSLWLKSAQKWKKLNNLDANIKCGNSLIDDPAVAEDKAFDWNKKFPQIIKKDFISNVFIDRNVDQKKIKKLQDDYWFETCAFPIDRYVWTKIDLEEWKEYNLNTRWLKYQDAKFSSYITEVLPIISYKWWTIQNIDNWWYCNNIFSIWVNEQEINRLSSKVFSCGQMIDEWIAEKFNEIQNKLLNIIWWKDVANNNIHDFMIMLNFLIQNSWWHSWQKKLKNEINSSNIISKCKYFISNEKNKWIFKFREKIEDEFGVKILTDEEFKEELEKFGKSWFDVIVWNPPYVFARENFDKKEKDYFVENYKSAQYQINTYFLFIELSVWLSKNKWYFGLIIPNSWLMISSGESLRQYILENTNFIEVINLLWNTFDDANVETIVMINQKWYTSGNIIRILDNETWCINYSHEKKQDDYIKSKSNSLYLFSDDRQHEIIGKIKKWTNILDNMVLIKAWLQAYESWKWQPKQTSEDVKNRPFDYDYKYDSETYMYLDWKDVQRYYISRSGLYLKYWEHLAAPRTFDLFDWEKIILREITGKYPKSLICVYDDKIHLFNRSNICIKQSLGNINLKYILILLSSSLMSYYFLCSTAKSVRKLFPKIILEDLRKFPIKEISPLEQQPFIEKADKMLSLNKEFHEKIDVILKFLQQKYWLEKISKKLQKFYELEFKDFVKQLKIKNISMEEERELMWLFEKDKAEVLILKQEIDSTDREIDEMVYKLYGLTEEEIKVVEGE